MGIHWAACILAIGLSADVDANRDTDNRSANAQRPAWVPKFFRGDWWKKKPTENPAKLRTDEASVRRPPLSLPSRRRTEQVSENLIISRCRAALHQESALRDCTIYVAADGDRVTLTGNVPDIVLKDRAERIARKTEGVHEVQNELVIANAMTNWLKPSGVTLALPPKPKETQSMRPSNEVVAVAGLPAKPATTPVPPSDAGPKSVANAVRPTRSVLEPGRVIPAPPNFKANSGWETIDRQQAPWIPKVTLGPPQRLASRSGLPIVVTYVVPSQQKNEALANGAATRIPATINIESPIPVSGVSNRPNAGTPKPAAPPALLPRIEPIRNLDRP